MTGHVRVVPWAERRRGILLPVADVQEELEAIEALVPEDAWLTVPDIVERLGSDVPKVRRLLDERLLVGVRRGRPRVFMVPTVLVEPEPLVSLPGTLTVLFDAGFSDAEALRWLFSPDEALGSSPVEALRANRIAPVRRVAQVLGY